MSYFQKQGHDICVLINTLYPFARRNMRCANELLIIYKALVKPAEIFLFAVFASKLYL